MKSSPIAEAIIRGEHDDELSHIQQACARRLKGRFRPGMKIEVTEGKMEGCTGEILKVNPKRIVVGLGDKVTEFGLDYWSAGQWSVLPAILRVYGEAGSR